MDGVVHQAPMGYRYVCMRTYVSVYVCTASKCVFYKATLLYDPGPL